MIGTRSSWFRVGHVVLMLSRGSSSISSWFTSVLRIIAVIKSVPNIVFPNTSILHCENQQGCKSSGLPQCAYNRTYLPTTSSISRSVLNGLPERSLWHLMAGLNNGITHAIWPSHLPRTLHLLIWPTPKRLLDVGGGGVSKLRLFMLGSPCYLTDACLLGYRNLPATRSV